MSLIEKSAEALSKMDDFKSLAEGIQEYLNADTGIDQAAAAAKITAELATGIAITQGLRTAMSALRLGLAVSGRISEWEALCKVLDIGKGEVLNIAFIRPVELVSC